MYFVNLPLISIGVVLYKWEKYIPYFLTSLLNQDYQWEIEFLFRDQDKELSATLFIKQNYPEIYKKCYFEAWKNLWHSGWQNRLIARSKWELYFCCSNDILYPQNFVSEIVNSVVKNDHAQMATCKIRRWDFAKIEDITNWKIDQRIEMSKSTHLDSCWVAMSANHYFHDIWQWLNDRWQFDKDEYIFWPSWAIIVFKRSAINKFIEIDWFVFDQINVPHYKNDVDLSYRANWHWIKTLFIPDVIVYHDRQLWKKQMGLFWAVKERRWRSSMQNISSLDGHLICLYKNFSFKYPIWVIIQTFLFELKKFIFILFFQNLLIKVYFNFLKKKCNIEKTKKDFWNMQKILTIMNKKY